MSDAFLSLFFSPTFLYFLKKAQFNLDLHLKGKAIPVTGRGGP
jgi:hypothetical protein